ncbi:MAG: TolC family protein [Gemmatimonadota bacterium]
MRSFNLSGVLSLTLAVAAPGIATAQEPLTLQRAIELAQSQGNQAVAARASRDAVLFRDRAFSARLLPQLSLGGTLPRYNRAIIPVLQPDGSTLFRPQNQTDAGLTATVTQQLPTGGDLFVSSSLATLSVTGEQSIRTWSSTPVSVGIRQDIFRPNTSRLDRREQPYVTQLAERQYLEAREEIAIQVTNLFFDVHAAGVALANATTNVAVNDTLYTLNKGRFEVGKIGENDLLQSELALLRARTALDGARLELDRARSSLRLALGLPADAPIELVVPTDVPSFPVDTALAVTEARKNRSTTTGAELSEIQAERRVTEARLNNGFGATVQASVGFNATASEFDFAYKNLLEARQVAVSVDIPLVQWGARRASVQAAEAGREEAERTAQISRDQAAQDAYFAALQLEQSRRALAISAKADTVAAKRFEVAYNRYVIGRIAIDNLYMAQGEKDQALMQYGQALRSHWLAYYRLRRLTLYDFERGVVIQ